MQSYLLSGNYFTGVWLQQRLLHLIMPSVSIFQFSFHQNNHKPSLTFSFLLFNIDNDSECHQMHVCAHCHFLPSALFFSIEKMQNLILEKKIPIFILHTYLIGFSKENHLDTYHSRYVKKRELPESKILSEYDISWRGNFHSNHMSSINLNSNITHLVNNQFSIWKESVTDL